MKLLSCTLHLKMFGEGIQAYMICGRRAQNRPDCIPLSSFLMEPWGAWLRGLYQQIREVWDLVLRQVLLIVSHPQYFRLLASTSHFLQAVASGAAQAEISSN